MRNIQIPSILLSEFDIPQIIDITDELPKNPVKDWDALNPPRKLEALTDTVWHHTGVPKRVGADAARHARNHIDSKANEETGDGGLPYQFYIKGGQIYQTTDLLTLVYAVSGNNYQTVNIAVEGLYCPDKNYPDYDLEVADEDKRCMIALELTLRELLPNYRQTNGHNFYQAKACPGFSMTKFREDITAAQVRYEFLNSEKGLQERAYRMANVVLYYYNMAQGKDEFGNPVTEGKRIWARQRLLLLEPAMKEHGFVK